MLTAERNRRRRNGIGENETTLNFFASFASLRSKIEFEMTAKTRRTQRRMEEPDNEVERPASPMRFKVVAMRDKIERVVLSEQIKRLSSRKDDSDSGAE